MSEQPPGGRGALPLEHTCTRCGHELTAVAGVTGTERITSGLCESCRTSVRHSLPDFLNTLDAPVVAVDPDVVVKIANSRANALFGKGSGEVLGKKAGDVFECPFARLPGGCGRTIHCSGCAIRINVAETHRTGEPRIRVPAYLCRGTADEHQEIGMHVSTEKIGDLVLLRIDRMDKGGRN